VKYSYLTYSEIQLFDLQTTLYDLNDTSFPLASTESFEMVFVTYCTDKTDIELSFFFHVTVPKRLTCEQA